MKPLSRALSTSLIVVLLFTPCIIRPVKLDTAPLPTPAADVSYCIADLKFDGEHIKICELGLCTWSYFKGHEALYSKGNIWENIWNHLSQFALPLWYIGKVPLSDAKKIEVAYKTLTDHGGTCVDSLEKLDQLLTVQKSHVTAVNPADLTSYHSIVILRNRCHKETRESIESFRRKHPEIIVMDAACAPYVNNKAKTNKLFTDQRIAPLKPDWRIFQKVYSKNLVTTIVHTFNHPTYVIKPTNSAEGRGVIITTQENLNDTLHTILGNPKVLKSKTDSSLNHWAYDHNQDFIMEAYAPSKPITVDNKEYDATMRVVFALTYHQSNIMVDFLGFYWKLPTHHLHEKGSLNEKHKSKVASGRKSSAIVNEQDKQQVMTILREALPVLYKKMLGHNS